MSFETLLSADHGPVRVLTLNRPKALNALDPTVIRELTEAVRIVAADAAEGRLRGLILTGAGKVFVAGADIAAM